MSHQVSLPTSCLVVNSMHVVQRNSLSQEIRDVESVEEVDYEGSGVSCESNSFMTFIHFIKAFSIELPDGLVADERE